MAPARDFTRRHFLRGLTASSIAMPAIVPSSVLGRDDKAAPSERIRVGYWPVALPFPRAEPDGAWSIHSALLPRKHRCSS